MPGFEEIPHKSIDEKLKDSFQTNPIKEVYMYDPKELNEAGLALAKVLNSLKASVDDDGKITLTDTVKFVDDVIPVYNGISGAQKIVVNIASISDEQKAVFKKIVLDELEFHPTDENAGNKLIDWIFSTVDLLVAFGVLKPIIEKPEI